MAQFGNLDTEELNKRVVLKKEFFRSESICVKTFTWPMADPDKNTFVIVNLSTNEAVDIFKKKSKIIGFQGDLSNLILSKSETHISFFGKRLDVLFHESLLQTSTRLYATDDYVLRDMNEFSDASSFTKSALRGWEAQYWFNEEENRFEEWHLDEPSISGRGRKIRVTSKRHLKMIINQLNSKLKKQS